MKDRCPTCGSVGEKIVVDLWENDEGDSIELYCPDCHETWILG